jgi:hypothetical protein
MKKLLEQSSTDPRAGDTVIQVRRLPSLRGAQAIRAFCVIPFGAAHAVPFD